MIDVESLSKTYRVHKRAPGFGPAIRSIFRRTYEPVHALSEVSFRIAAGERVGFLGPNGAGKTTTLKILAGLLHPTSGRATVAGHDPGKCAPDFLRTITLVMGQKQQLLWDLPPAETFAMNRALYDLPKAESEATVKRLVEMLEIGPLIGKPTRQLSLGERMKCELVAALLHKPRVLFLDEPTIGLDVAMQARMRVFIREYNETTGATVILTSHYMEDVVALCPRVIVIDKGHLVYDGDLRALVRRTRPDKRVTIRFSAAPTPEALARLGHVDGHAQGQGQGQVQVQVIDRQDLQITLQVPTARVNEVVRDALAQLPVADLAVEDPPLEEVMRELFKNSAAERARTPADIAAATEPAP